MKKTDDENKTDHDIDIKKNNEIRVLSSDDEKIKVVGEVLANESSRTILKLLSSNDEMTINQMAREISLSIPLVSHHLKKMQDAGVVEVSRIGTSVKGQKMKYYSATNQSFLITPPERQAHSIFNSLRTFSKFAAIGMAGIVSWAMLKPTEPMPLQTSQREVHSTGPEASSVDEWSSTSEMDLDSESTSISDSKEKLVMESVSEPTPMPEPEPSHSGIQNSASQFTGSDAASTGSISLDRTVYPEPFVTSGADPAEPLIFSIIIPIAIIAGGILLERILTRWYDKRKKRIL
ncbi:winged helix-turn-helix domain-containing protein [archaeon]|nr:winged helix-turn-helix domain-containing protein [archaeon]